MKHLVINELPLEYQDLYANKIYFEITKEKIIYDSETISMLLNYFIKNEDYDKCIILKEYEQKKYLNYDIK